MVKQAEMPSDVVRADTAERILDCAEALFRHFGYAKTNVADIARDLGMSPANIYRFFPSKSAIHHAIAERMLNVIYRSVLAIFNRDISACEKLYHYAAVVSQHTVEMMTSENKVHEMVVVAMEQHWPVVSKHISRMEDMIQDVVRQGIDEGEFPEQDEVVAARCFCSSLAVACHPVLVTQFAEDERGPTLQQLVQFAINSLKCRLSDRAP